jgi:RNA:NAD 2'-phosphotransferase (TPT1/KptA family)
MSGHAQSTNHTSQALVRISKSMSRVLRHDPPSTMDQAGWVPLPDLIRKLGGNVTAQDIQSVAGADAKGRFEV